jgi:hypothetical protein
MTLFLGERAMKFFIKLGDAWTAFQRPSSSVVEGRLSNVFDRLKASEIMITNLMDTVATLEQKLAAQELQIKELAIDKPSQSNCSIPQPMPRSYIPLPPPLPPPMPHIMSYDPDSIVKKFKREEPQTPKVADSTSLGRQRPLSSELKKRKGQLRQVSSKRSPGGTPLSNGQNKNNRRTHSTPDDGSDLHNFLGNALRNKFKSYRPPSPIVGSPPDGSTFGSEDFSFSFTA